MTEKEKQIQIALGTLPTFSVTIRGDFSASNRGDALEDSREVMHLLRKNFPDWIFRKNTMKSTDN